MQERHERLQQAFDEWRGKSAITENNFIKTALLVDEFFRSFETIKDFENAFKNFKHLEAYKKLDQYGESRTLGAILYCRMSFAEAIKKIPDSAQEKEPLIALRDILTRFYVSPYSLGKADLAQLIANVNKFLNIKVNDFEHSKMAKELYFDLYGIISILKNKLENVNRAIIMGAKFAGVDLTQVKIDLQQFSEKTIKQIEQLDGLATTSPIKEKTLQEHLNEDILNLLESNLSEHERLGQTKIRIEEISKNLTQIISIRNEKSIIDKQINQIDILLKAIVNNPEELYFDYLKDKYSTEFYLLLAISSTDSKLQLLKDMEGLYNQNGMVSGALFIGSMMTSPAKSLSKWFAPELTKDIASQLPDTWDSVCKHDLKELAEQQLTLLLEEQKRFNELIDKHTNPITKGSKNLKNLIDKTPIETLQQIKIANNHVNEVIESYVQTAKLLKVQRIQLMEYQGKFEALDKFIKKHDDFFVTLSNFFATLFPNIFTQSNTALMIDQAKSLKNEMQILCKQFEVSTNEHLDKMKANTFLSAKAKEKLNKEHAEVEAQPEQVHIHKKNFQKTISLFKESIVLAIEESPKETTATLKG